jgi:hypothetical protein
MSQTNSGLDISGRGCDVTQHINVRGQNEGDDVVTAVDVMLKNIMLTPAETNVVLKDPEAYDRLFRKRVEGEAFDPAFKTVSGIPLNYKIESARVEINTGAGKPIVLAECKLNRLRIELRDNGGCALQAQIQTAPNLDSAGARLLKLIGAHVHISIRAQNVQQDLELPAGEGKRAVSGGFKPTRTGKQIDAETRANAKRKRKAAKAVKAKTNGNGSTTPIHGRTQESTPDSEPAA